MNNRVALVVAYTRWNEPPRMRHYVTEILKKKFSQVVFVEYFPWERGNGCLVNVEQNFSILSVFGDGVRWKNWFRFNLPCSHRSYKKRQAIIIKRELERAGLNLDYLYLFNFCYDFYSIYDSIEFKWSSYFCFDEWPRMQRSSSSFSKLKTFVRGPLLQLRENRVFLKASCVFSPHNVLYRKALQHNPNTVRFLHGVNHDFIRQPGYQKNINKKIKVGFGGFLNYRIDFNLLKEVVFSRDLELHLVGEVERSFIKEVSVLREMGCVLAEGLKRKAFVDYLSQMDVLIMPYKVHLNEVAVITTSAKTFQYVSTLRPIVMPEMPNYIDLGADILYTFKRSENFIQTIREAYYQDSHDKQLVRQKVALQNTWANRGELLATYFNAAD